MLKNYSPNMIKTYINCPKQFYYKYIDNFTLPHSQKPFEKGEKIHALANYNLQGIKIDRIENALTREEKDIWESLKQNPFYNMKVLKTEFVLNAKINKFWINGRIDAIVMDNNEYYILDYKTGTIPKNPEYDPQTMVYLYCVDKYLKDYSKLSFVYINLRDKNNYVIEYTPLQKKDYQIILETTCDKINEDNSYKQNKKNCLNCEYNRLCFAESCI